jgi:biopolymer transport protein ExbD
MRQAMSRFNRLVKYKNVPALNMASLPDLIFTILFFFMLVTTMRTAPIKTQMNLPSAAERQKLKEKEKIVYIMMGSDTTILQLNYDFITLDELSQNLEKIKHGYTPDEQRNLTAVLKIDKSNPMSVVNKIKQGLRDAGILTVHYSAEASRLPAGIIN